MAKHRIKLMDKTIIDDITYLPKWLSEQQADTAYQALSRELAWHQGDVFIFGKWHKIPRLQAFHGEPNLNYRYSGKWLAPEPWTPALAYMRERLFQIGFQPNVVLANWYRDGNDKMGWHRDNEPELGSEPVILSISLGATRDFDLRNRTTKETRRVALEHGSLLIMQGSSQIDWEHQLPARKRCTEGRINLTFRTIVR